ncbi:F-box only protein 33 [Teleopsis dalmanni]|uniref:F-box only protein 33 n=1 Tax=Teleopsis dalmanni TaxID=139649 RepID=UPI0018CD46E4|nr:F-box only protein 33 [Teleopsis dalmanni]XP_037937873.1 F-box only protein 33 [Teleopsis dalmanni]XP_037937882.1 F-box only protein 33 [Teleopsis dalmanni]XP_037937889.1 F-box only protein 33 [Teleopsis dalmanni]
MNNQWAEIPILALGEIYSYLQPEDRFNASLVCRHWRGVLFQRRFFSNFKFKLHIGNERQCVFFRNSISNLTSELIIIFDFHNVFHIEKIRRILYRIARCENIQGLRFQTNSVGFIPPGDISDENLVDIEQIFVEPLKYFLSRKGTSCRVLDLGSIETLTYYAHEFLKSFKKPQALEELTLASLKYDPCHYSMLVIENSMLQKFTSLQVLSLDYDSVNEELINTIRILPLKKLLIFIHGLDRTHPGISDASWQNFANNFPSIELYLTLIYAYEAVEVLQVRILRRSMPLTHLRVLFCDFINAEALEWLSIHNSGTLKSVQWIDSACKHSDKSVMDLFMHSGQDPLIMMSWRCHYLEEIVIHGYVLDPHNIVGISRLRGNSLKRLEVSMIDETPDELTMDTFIEEINILLGQKWQPLTPNQLHPALGYTPVTEEARDDFVFDLIRSDIFK